MREAMASAEVGDEQSFADPTVNALCERVAELLGFEAAVFLPSGTMCNAIAFRLHIGPAGDEVYLHRTSHPIVAEAGGPAALSGAVLCPLDGERGMFTADTLRGALRPAGDRYLPRSRLVSVEQTTNLTGGHVWPREQLSAVVEVAREASLRLHMDGARLMNAVVASGLLRRLLDRRVRHRLGRLLQGARRAGGRLPGGVAGADRRGVALQADVGRLDAPGGDHRRGRAVRPRPPRRAPRRRPRAGGVARARAGGGAGRRGSTPPRSRPTSWSSRSPTPARWWPGSRTPA